MRTITPTATTTLTERAFFARGWRAGWLVVSERGVVTVLDRDLTTTAVVDTGGPLQDATLTETLVCASDRGLVAHDVETGELRWQAEGTFLACRHTADGRGLWAAMLDGAKVWVTLRAPDTGAIHLAVAIDDPFGGSAAELSLHADARAVVVWLAAGQDGQAAFFVREDGAGAITTEIAPRDRSSPVFVTAGDSYLSVGDDLLEYRIWPSGEILDELEWAGEDDDPDDHGGRAAVYLPGGFATWPSAYGRLHVVDLTAMVVVDELVLAGHPLQPLETLHPLLAGERTPATDFEYAEPGPDGLVLTVHARTELVASRLADWSPDESRVR